MAKDMADRIGDCRLEKRDSVDFTKDPKFAELFDREGNLDMILAS